VARATPTKLVREFQRAADLGLNALAQLTPPINPATAMQYLARCEFCSSSLLLVALVKWRHRVEDPTESVNAFLALSRSASAAVRPFPIDGRFYPFNIAVWLNLIVAGGFDQPLLDHLAAPDIMQTSMDYPFAVSDAALFQLIRTGLLPAEWDEFTRHRANAVDHSGHFAESILAYADLIRRLIAGDADAAAEQVARAEDLFKRRNNTSDYKCLDGGFKCNPNVVDYRLGAILHHYRSALGKNYPLANCAHCWVW
jgi:hypothetical protein